MGCSGYSPLKTRIGKRKRAMKRRFYIMVIFTLAIIFCISYGMVRKNDNESTPTQSTPTQSTPTQSTPTKSGQNISVSEIVYKNGSDYKSLPKNDGMIYEDASLSEESGQTEVPDPLTTGEDTPAAVESRVNPKYEVLVRNLQIFLKGIDGKYGIYFLSLKDGSEFGINHKEKFTAASTIKIPINLYLFKKIKGGSVNPKDRLTYKRVDYETGTGIIQKSTFGKTYTIRELSRLSIEVSDNVATNMLLRLLGIDNVKSYMRQLGGTVVVGGENVTCPYDMGIYMRKVYNFYNEDRVLGKELMGYFLNTSSSDRIPALLPKSVKVAHKIGNQVNTMNDVGVVFSREPYIISILSKDVNEAEAVGVIAKISKKVYDFVE